MRSTKNNTIFWNFILMIVVSMMGVGIIYFSGCAPTAKQTTTISPERRKAIQDSIRKAYIFEIDKNWSTGYEYYKNKIYRRAIKPFWRVIKLDTIDRFRDVYGFLSTCYFEVGVPDSAQLALEMGIKKYPNNVGLRRNLAYLLSKKEMIDEAITEYEKVVKLDSTEVNDWKQLANLYVRNDQMDDAIEAYQKIIALDPSDKEAQETLGQLLRGSGDEEAAIAALEKALKLDPQNTQLLFDLGKSYFNQAEYDKAIQKLNAYLAKKPDDFVAMEYLGNSLSGNGEYRKAITVYKKIVEARPDNKKVYTDIATCYKELKEFQRARQYAYKALKVDKNYGLAYITIGEIYEDAVDHCMRARGRKAPKFDDKLVFLEAYRQYKKAAKDLQYQDQASKKMSYLKDFLPTKEDQFFNKNRKLKNGKYKVVEKCYLWIASSI